MIFIALCLASWGIHDFARRDFANRLATFAVFLGVLLMMTSLAGDEHPNYVKFVAIWVAEFGVLVSGLRLLMPAVGLHLTDLLGRESVSEERTTRWNDVAIIHVGVRPLVSLFTLFCFATVRYAAGPQYPLLSKYGLSYASLLPAALIFPFACVTVWGGSLNCESSLAIGRQIDVAIRGRLLAILLPTTYLAGLLFQYKLPAGQPYAWTACCLCFSLVLSCLWLVSSRNRKLSDAVTQSGDSPPTGNRFVSKYTFAVLVVSAFLYLALGLVK